MNIPAPAALRSTMTDPLRLALLLPAALLVGPLATAQAQEAQAQEAPASDKRAYHLFNPTPRDLMRPLSADRPDVTESPHTVDAGHVQLELSFVEYTRDHHNDANADTDAWTAGAANVKLGVLNNLDLQLVFDAYIHERNDLDAGPTTTTEGFGDTQLRAKLNLWGNDTGDTALAVMPFVTFPTAHDDALDHNHIEGGIILPFGIALPDEFGLGLQAEVDFVFDEDDDAYDTEFAHTAALGRPLVGPLSGFVEYVGVVSTDPDTDYAATLGTGLVYEIHENLALDTAVSVALTEQADDLTVLAGLTWRY